MDAVYSISESAIGGRQSLGAEAAPFQKALFKGSWIAAVAATYKNAAKMGLCAPRG
jgi:hypothetical protein